MEFVGDGEVGDLLREFGITSEPEGETRVLFKMTQVNSQEDVARLHISSGPDILEAEADATLIEMPKDKLADSVNDIIHGLHLQQILLFPTECWQTVFDAVAFSLAENEEWQAFETAATVKLRTRDPLLVLPEDLHTIHAFLKALMADGEGAAQSLYISASATPMLIELNPDGAARLAFGSRALADEAAESISTG